MKNKNDNTIADFHAVDFMRQVRNELSEQFLQDRQKYVDYLKRVMDEFKLRQQKRSTK
jgi:hypothetical protein